KKPAELSAGLREISVIYVLFFLQAQREWKVLHISSPTFVGLVGHFEVQYGTIHKVAMLEVVLSMSLAIERYRLDIAVFFAVVWRLDFDGLAIGQLDGHLLEERCTHDIFIGRRCNRIEAQCREHIPR